MILIIAYYFSELWAEKQGYGTLTTEEGIFKGTTMESSKTMMYILAAEHVIAYMFGIYREHEIEKVGFIDPQSGIKSAPCETKLRYVEISMDFVIFVIFLVHFFKIGNEAFNDCPLNHFWILTDIIIMMVSLPYAYMVQIILVTSEVTKNVFTLF